MSTVPDTYGDGEWNDLLTSYNGNTITYNAIGNPISYRGKTFEWTNGRELAEITVGGDEWKYAYNADGIRKSKEYDDFVYGYAVLDGKIMYPMAGEFH